MSGEYKRPWDRTRRVLGPLVAPWYAAAVRRVNQQFDAGMGVQRVGVPVVSIGNLTVGGTGKTPMTAWLCRQLQSRGVRPMIAMRGYRAGMTGSDEAGEYARLLPGVPVVVNADRAEGIEAALRAGVGADCVVLDDGFQHRRLHRNLDIVLIDASRDIFAEKMFPTGDLREPLEGLRRAQVVVLTHAERVDAGQVQGTKVGLSKVIGRHAEGTLLTAARHEWGGLEVSRCGVEGSEGVDWLRGKRVVAVCAIGYPDQFVQQVEQAGEVVGQVVRPDHDVFAPSVVKEVTSLAQRQNADAIVTTEKDWSKLALVESSVWPCPVVRPRLAIRVDDGGRLVEAVMRLLPERP